MSLNWDTTKVQYFQDNPEDLYVTINKGTPDEYEDLNAETKSLVFGSMAVGIGNISISNASDWYARWKIYEKFDDFYLYGYVKDGGVEKVYLTPEILIKHINLTTNVSLESNALWVNRYFKAPSINSDDAKPTKREIQSLLNQYKKEFESALEQMLTNNKKESMV